MSVSVNIESCECVCKRMDICKHVGVVVMAVMEVVEVVEVVVV